MGGCCSCCGEDEGGVPEGRSNRSYVRHATQGSSGVRGSTRGSERQTVCGICGLAVDPALLEGHQETCRANHRRAMAAGGRVQVHHVDVAASDGHSDEEICIVCLERLRCFAFLPCGHIACCGECAKQLDACPLCRQPRNGLCYVPVDTLSQYQCKHCQQFIAPALFDGHREVCALRLRQAQLAQQEQEREQRACAGDAYAAADAHVESNAEDDEAAKPHAPTAMEGALIVVNSATNSGFPSDGDVSVVKPDAAPSPPPPPPPPTASASAPTPSPPSHTSAADGAPPAAARPRQHILKRCVECGHEAPHLVISLPCGHRVMCADCAQRRSTCPVCLQEVTQTLATYE